MGAPLHNLLSTNGLRRFSRSGNARFSTLTIRRGDKMVTNWEPAAKPGAGARRAIFPHGKARRWRRLAPSTEEQRCPVGKGPPPAGELPTIQPAQPHASTPPTLFPLPVPVMQLAPRFPKMPRRHFLLGNPPASPPEPCHIPASRGQFMARHQPQPCLRHPDHRN